MNSLHIVPRCLGDCSRSRVPHDGEEQSAASIYSNALSVGQAETECTDPWPVRVGSTWEAHADLEPANLHHNKLHCRLYACPPSAPELPAGDARAFGQAPELGPDDLGL